MHFADKSKKINDRKIRKLDPKTEENGKVATKRVTIVEQNNIDEYNNKKNKNGCDNCGFMRDE